MQPATRHQGEVEVEVRVESPRAAMLREEFERATVRLLQAGARVRMTIQSGDYDLEELADLADDCAIKVGRVAGFARLLKASTK